MGRCGSSLISTLLASVTARIEIFASSYETLRGSDASLIKTHTHLKRALPYEYKAVYMYGAVTPIIRSLYKLWRDKKYGFVKEHLENLEVKKFDRFVFNILYPLNQASAFFYLISGDKFRFKENMASWKSSKSTIFIKYEDLISSNKEVMMKISDFLGVQLPELKINDRFSRNTSLPRLLEKEIEKVYGELAK